MNTPSPDAGRPLLQVHGDRTSSVIVHRVPANFVDRFLQWQQGITRAAEAFAGYQATEMYPPADSHQPDWVIIIHFDDSQALQKWLDSPTRAEWTAKLPAEIANFRIKTLSVGFGPWFAGLVRDGGFPPHWKLALAVLLALYPAVMLFTLYLSPHTAFLGFAGAMLVSNAASSCFLEWVGVPILNRVLARWLTANGKEGRVVTIVGLILIIGALTLMVLLFQQLSDAKRS